MAFNIGDTVAFDVSFDYQGPAYNFGKLRAVIGVQGVTFNEKCWTELTLVLPITMTWDTFTQRVSVVLKNVELGETYDSYVKLMPKIGLQEILFWHGTQNIQMASAYPDSEFRNLTVVVG